MLMNYKLSLVICAPWLSSMHFCQLHIVAKSLRAQQYCSLSTDIASGFQLFFLNELLFSQTAYGG